MWLDRTRRPAFHRSAALCRAAARATTTESLASLSQPRLPYCATDTRAGSEPRDGLIIGWTGTGTGGGTVHHRGWSSAGLQRGQLAIRLCPGSSFINLRRLAGLDGRGSPDRPVHHPLISGRTTALSGCRDAVAEMRTDPCTLVFNSAGWLLYQR